MSDCIAVPTDSRGLKPRNLLLGALPVSELSCLQPHLEAVSLARGRVIFDINEPVTRVYFVETGVVSLLAVLESGAAAGVATVGREGVVGAATLLLGGESALGCYRVLVPVSALAVQVGRFRDLLRRSPKLQAACEGYTRALFVQVLQAVCCGRMHTVEQRCARWLLMCDDQTEGDTVEITQESLAKILAVPRSTVTAVASTLQRAGLIGYGHGGFTVVDRPGLEAAACECYRIVRDRVQRLLGHPFA